MAIKAEFHTNRNIKIKGDENENDGEHNTAHKESNGGTSSVDEVKELNYQEKSRLHELYEASRSLSCPLEQDKDVSSTFWILVFYNNTLHTTLTGLSLPATSRTGGETFILILILFSMGGWEVSVSL